MEGPAALLPLLLVMLASWVMAAVVGDCGLLSLTFFDAEGEVTGVLVAIRRILEGANSMQWKLMRNF